MSPNYFHLPLFTLHLSLSSPFIPPSLHLSSPFTPPSLHPPALHLPLNTQLHYRRSLSTMVWTFGGTGDVLTGEQFKHMFADRRSDVRF